MVIGEWDRADAVVVLKRLSVVGEGCTCHSHVKHYPRRSKGAFEAQLDLHYQTYIGSIYIYGIMRYT